MLLLCPLSFDCTASSLYYTTPDAVMVTLVLGLPLSEPCASTARTMSMPWMTSPKTTCLPSS
jgi:hypothetical protein